MFGLTHSGENKNSSSFLWQPHCRVEFWNEELVQGLIVAAKIETKPDVEKEIRTPRLQTQTEITIITLIYLVLSNPTTNIWDHFVNAPSQWEMTSFLISWMHTQDDPCNIPIKYGVQHSDCDNIVPILFSFTSKRQYQMSEKHFCRWIDGKSSSKPTIYKPWKSPIRY